jgi:hypothetical protein
MDGCMEGQTEKDKPIIPLLFQSWSIKISAKDVEH